MSKLDTLQEEGVRSDLMLQLHLKALRKALRQQLLETEKRQAEELEKRIYQNALLSADVNKKSVDKKEQTIRFVGMRASTSISGVLSDETSHKPKQRPLTSSPVWVPSANWKPPPVTTQLCERFASTITTHMTKEVEAEAECQKKFCAAPVPSHIIQPIYQEMIEVREKERKLGHEQRKLFLLSIQKPFSFQQREYKKRERPTATSNQVSQDPKTNVHVRKVPHNDIKDSRKLKAQQENPAQTGSTKPRSSEITRKKKLGFLFEEPSFHPKVIHQVPDFSKLHKALQTKALGKVQSKDGTKCQPFFLRTSALPARKFMKSPETSQAPPMSNISKNKLVTTDTLPTFITDAVRKRCLAVRHSMEMRESKNQESSDWLRSYQSRSKAMKNAVALHAKLLDPHSSLKEVHSENLQRHREADQQRMRDYKRELQDMKARVSQRPYLFEQVKQEYAKARAEQAYSSKLKKVGLKEEFVEQNGEAIGSDDDAETNDSSNESDTQDREENVDDGEKIEDVEKKSVKSKGEEMP